MSWPGSELTERQYSAAFWFRVILVGMQRDLRKHRRVDVHRLRELFRRADALNEAFGREKDDEWTPESDS